jgi:hypothetical protein
LWANAGYLETTGNERSLRPSSSFALRFFIFPNKGITQLIHEPPLEKENANV